MKRLALSIAISATVSVSAQATTYDVSGYFETGTADSLEISLGVESLLQNGSYLNVGGQIISDGTDITGGIITITGQQLTNQHYLDVTGQQLTIDINMSGTATNSGVLFTSGTICFTEVTACDDRLIDISVDNADFRDGLTWGYNSGLGLQLGDGTQTGNYTIAQNGDIASVGTRYGAAGRILYLGFEGGVFLAGDLAFSEVASVPVPAAAWLFGSALIGLAGIGRKRHYR
jgi:hypothetical protein